MSRIPFIHIDIYYLEIDSIYLIKCGMIEEKIYIYIRKKFWYLKNYIDTQAISCDGWSWNEMKRIKCSKTIDSNDSWMCKCQYTPCI